MKHYNRTLLELEHKLALSKSGTVACISAAEFHGTKAYAQEDTARHRNISRSIRESLQQLVKKLDWYDQQVEDAHQNLVRLKIE